LQRAATRLTAAAERLHAAGLPELAAEEFKTALDALGEITGEFSSEDLLGRIFASFCIGK
jgi:tRNA modification GTPase